ncbi:hypothetical protein O181_038345 [Austropuccinia psidii MF-1]|uniref:Chromo domain-containing protein n=1 Tax=Austropuccinia psidii MF-1 TaxID=1389203 RepID=A0A9Q3D9N6_9BASI|nr:hypothetical protein [Austropuccinia psidii MF-1]
MSSKDPTRLQAHWAEFLSKYHFSITYRPGLLATLPDALSHWDNIYPERGGNFISKNPINYQRIIKQDEIQPSKFFAVKVECFSNSSKWIQKELWQDPQYRNQVVVSNDPTIQLRILQKGHNSPLAGHPGQEKTLKLFKKDFHWSVMTRCIMIVGSLSNLEESQNSYLLSQWKSINPGFYISLLEPVKTSTIPNWRQEPPPPIIIEEEEEWEVSQILDSEIKRGKLRYLVECKGFSQDQERSTWELTKNLMNLPELLKDFHSLYPEKPGPNPSRA